jgi:hypothetical protein
VNPTRPNVIDYVSFLYGSVGIPIPPEELPTATGTATSGSTTTLVDATQLWTTNQWNGYGVGDATQRELAWVATNTATMLTFMAPAPAPVATGDIYIVAPAVVFTSFAVALAVVNPVIAVGSCTLYVLAVYNLAADRLINYAPDQPNQTYFSDQRKNMHIFIPRVGVPSAANDNGTSVGILNPEFMKTLTMRDLQTLKTPFGRQYMEIALDYGPNLWGVT